MRSTLKQKLAACILLLASTTITNAQQADNWFFGWGAGLNFSGTTPTVLTGGALFTNEGCATVSDNTGSLLFYTDGTNVWNSAHTLVNPSSPLMGNSSSTQSSVIIPKPGSSTNYYIFTQDEHGLNTCADGLRWTEVQVSGLTITFPSMNNLLLTCSSTTEKITGVCHSNGTDYWAVTVQSDGQFVSYPVTSAGVGSPVYSGVTATPCITSGSWINDDKVGYMKVSHQGNLLGLARRHSSSVNELFTFNNTTGMVTSNLGTYRTGTTYGLEFSPTGSFMYVTNFNSVFQVNTSTLAVSTLHTDAGYIGALQLGPDGNIYVASGYEGMDGSFLDRIENSDLAGPTYVDNYLTLPTGMYSRLGLPDLVNCFVPNVGCELDASFEAVFDPHDCAYIFNDASNAGPGTNIVAWYWEFGDGSSSTEQNPVHHYSSNGTYNVCLTIVGYNGQECCTSKKCMQVQVHDECVARPCDMKIKIHVAEGECGNCTFDFSGDIVNSNRPIVAWLWDFGDGTTGTGQYPSHQYTSPGNYTVCVTVVGLDPGAEEECCTRTFCRDIKVDCGIANPQKSSQVLPGYTGLFENNNSRSEQNLRVYPNPANDKLFIELMLPSEQSLRISITDINGRTVSLGTLERANGMVIREIDLSGIASGMYLLKVEGTTISYLEKIQVIKR